MFDETVTTLLSPTENISMADSAEVDHSTLHVMPNEANDFDEDLDLDDFQVVRREFFAHIAEPAVTFNNYKFYVNSACLSKFPNAEYVEVLIDPERKILVLYPCAESERDSFSWCTQARSGKRKPRQTTCRIFWGSVFAMMNWNPDSRYKMIGKIRRSKNGMDLLAFDLTATEIYERTSADGEPIKTARKPAFPAEWKGQFGMSFKEQRQSLQIDTFDGFAVYSLRDPGKNPVTHSGEDNTAESNQLVLSSLSNSAGETTYE